MVSYYATQVLLLKEKHFPQDALCRQVKQAKEFIDQHFSEAIDINTLAHQASYSEYHFIRVFKMLYGVTPHQYLITTRIEKAKHLLRLGKSVTNACHEVGFTSHGSFTALYKKITGHTPSAYKSHTSQSHPPIPFKFVVG